MAVLVPIEKLEPWKFNEPQIILMTKNEAEFVEVNFYKNPVSGHQVRLIHFYRRSENNGEFYEVYLGDEALKWIGYFVSALGIPKKLEVNNERI